MRPTHEQNYHLVIIFQRRMTFVNQSPKWLLPCYEDTPGPGAYHMQTRKLDGGGSSSFVSKTLRDQEKTVGLGEVGPGSYNLDKNAMLQTHSHAVFKSKIQRFVTKKEEKGEQPKAEIEQKFQQLVKYAQRPKGVPGKLITYNQRRQFQKKLMPQLLPSIPTQESSYGYRYDQNSKKLVQNQNPKIMFANVLSSTNQDFYFQRTQSYMGKGVQFSIQKNVQRHSPELTYQVSLPDPTKYQPQVTANVSTTSLKKMNAFSSQKERFEETPSPKNLLKLQKLKREFKDYIPKDLELEELQKNKGKLLTVESQSTLRKGKNLQCFLSKIDRFKQRKTVQKQNQKQKIQLKIVDRTTQKQNTRLQKTKNKKRQPYDLGQARFKEKRKQNLGPGYYDIKPEEHNAPTLGQKQERFKTEEMAFDMPGPGTYEIDLAKGKEKERMPFTRYVCNNERDKNRFSSMESLYEEIGKQLNYETKAERQPFTKYKETSQKQVKAYEVYKRDFNRMKELVK